MRHQLKHRKLNRTSSHRRALFANMAQSLIEHEQIHTTLPKAKALRSYAEKLITLAKRNNLSSRRQLAGILYTDVSVSKICDVLASRYAERNGGYTRIVKCNNRPGDNAPMAIIELVDRNISAKGAADLARVAAEKAENEE
ncbi:MAG: 50S ribosomal protein L17 [Rickettsiales bacterium]